MTDAKLKTAAEMYFYILSCPGRLLPWFAFYSDLFQNKPPNQIVLTLNRVLKGEKNTVNKNAGLRKIAENLFTVIATNSTFKYKEIKRMTLIGNSSSTKAQTPFKLKGKIFQ